MIIRGVILMLGVVDFVFNVYDKIREVGAKFGREASDSKHVVHKSDPSYSV